MLFEELEEFMKLETDEHQIFVDSVIIHLIPMQIGNIEEGIKPFLLLL